MRREFGEEERARGERGDSSCGCHEAEGAGAGEGGGEGVTSGRQRRHIAPVIVALLRRGRTAELTGQWADRLTVGAELVVPGYSTS